MSNVKYFSLAKLDDYEQEQPFMAEIFNDQSLKNEIQKETIKILRKMANLEMKENEKQKINYKKGAWYTKVDENKIAYITLTSPDYPERIAYQMIQSLQDKVNDMSQTDQSQDISKIILKNEMKVLASRYDDLSQVDKISQAQAGVDDVKIQMQDNIKKFVDNQAHMEKLASDANQLGIQGKQFEKSSSDLENLLKWRNRKLNLIIFLVGLSLFLYILIPIVSR